MRDEEEALIDLHVGSSKGNCLGRLFWLLSLPLLIFAGAVAAYIGAIPLRMEAHSVVMIGMIFLIYLLFIAHNAWYGACKFKKRQTALGVALEKYIDKNLLEIGGVHKANAPFDQFIKEFTASLRNDNFASVAATIFPTLGILGTFISIAMTMPDFSSRDSAQLEQEISQLLGGVGTAFYISIYGIFLSLWWIFFEKKGMSEFERLVRLIREKTRSYFWTREEIEQVHFTRSMQNYENLSQIFSKITSNAFLDNLQSALEERMQLFESIIHHEQKALRKSGEHFDEILRLSEKSIQASERLFDAYDTIRMKMDDIVQSLDKSHKQLRLVNQELTTKEQGLERMTHLLSQRVEQLSRALESVQPENMERIYRHVRESLESMQLQSQKVAAAFDTHLNRFDEAYANKLRTSLELIDSETAKIIRQLASLKEGDR